MTGKIILTRGEGQAAVKTTLSFNLHKRIPLYRELTRRDCKITSLVFDHITFSQGTFSALLDTLQHNTSLQHIEFKDCTFSHSSFESDLATLATVSPAILDSLQVTSTESTPDIDALKIKLAANRSTALCKLSINGKDMPLLGLKLNTAFAQLTQQTVNRDALTFKVYDSIAQAFLMAKRTNDAIPYLQVALEACLSALQAAAQPPVEEETLKEASLNVEQHMHDLGKLYFDQKDLPMAICHYESLYQTLCLDDLYKQCGDIGYRILAEIAYALHKAHDRNLDNKQAKLHAQIAYDCMHHIQPDHRDKNDNSKLEGQTLTLAHFYSLEDDFTTMLKLYKEAYALREMSSQQHTDGYWRMLLKYAVLIAQAGYNQDDIIDISEPTHYAQLALQHFYQLQYKNADDYVLAADAARIMAVTQKKIPVFIDQVLFKKEPTTLDILSELHEIAQKLQQDRYKQARELFLQALQLVIHQHTSPDFPHSPIQQFLQTDGHLAYLKKYVTNLQKVHAFIEKSQAKNSVFAVQAMHEIERLKTKVKALQQEKRGESSHAKAIGNQTQNALLPTPTYSSHQLFPKHGPQRGRTAPAKEAFVYQRKISGRNI